MNIKIPQNLYEVAVDYYNSGNFELAKSHALSQLELSPGDINSLKLLAFMEYQSGDYTQALAFLDQITQQTPNIAEINNLIGCIYLNARDYAKSIEYLSKAIKNDVRYIDAYLNLAKALQMLHHTQESIMVLKNALNIFPNNLNILAAYAPLCFNSGDLNSAIQTYQQWVNLEPTNIVANAGLARAYLAIDAEDKVIDLLDKLKAQPDRCPKARLDVVNELLHYGKVISAINAYCELINDFEQKEIIYNNLATAYDHMGDSDKAIEYFLKAITQNDQYAAAHLNIGRVYTDIVQLDLAEKHLRYALQLEPDNVNALINMGRLYDNRSETLKAKTCFERAIELEPKNPVAHCNLGNSLQLLGDYENSCREYHTCLRFDPSYGDAEQNLGINELAMGKFNSAWGHYFKRIRNLEKGEQLSPITPGMSLQGKHVYFCRSQGIGDELFFLRFLPLLKQQDVTITYRASDKTVSLLSQVKEIDHLISENAEIPLCDYYFTIDDIPLILNINDISKIPPPLPLQADEARIKKAQQLLADYPPPYTGITWRAGTQEPRKSNKDNQRNLNKAFPLDFISSITSPLEGSLVILQRDPDINEINLLRDTVSLPVIDFSDWNDSLEDILALLSLIGRYVGVSNTNMHLFASLGKSAEVLVPFPPEWRWMIRGDHSPWFPKFNIFRQASDGDWSAAISKLIKYYGSQNGG